MRDAVSYRLPENNSNTGIETVVKTVTMVLHFGDRLSIVYV